MMLRDYQKELYNKTKSSFSKGSRRVLVVAPCGAGKSYLFAEMIRNTKGEALVLTHRQELKQQHEALFREQGITNARVSMILTEVNRLGQYERPALIVADEAHLSRSNSWMRVIEYYDTWTVGLTATPIRLDGKPLNIFDTLVTGVDVKWLIKNKRLAPFEYYAPTAVETDGIRKVGGDYIISDLERLMDERAIYSNVLKSWESIAKGEKTIAYCVSVKHARETAKMFSDAGYPAVEIDGETPAKKRSEIMQDFRDGKIMALCNVGIISEGVSIDDVTCCLLLRPTESHALYWQQGMRCMRYQEGKVAKVIDCVGNYLRNPIFDADVEWSLTKTAEKKPRFNENGDFHIRTCPKCFMIFPTAPTCPFCSADYPLHPREIQKKEEIELARITAEEAEKVAQQKKEARREQGRANSFEELVKLGKQRGYKNPAFWAQKVMRARKR